jgi:hypothetical protein
MSAEPEIVMRDGPAGVRPGLRGGPDIWEVVAVHRSFRNVTRRTAAWLDLPIAAADAALAYYESHRSEIDQWIEANEAAAESAIRMSSATRRIASSDEGLTEEEVVFFESGVLEKSIDEFLAGDLGSGDAAERTWNRACSPMFAPTLPGDRALRDVIAFDGEISNGGLDFAIDEEGYREADAAAEGLRLLSAHDLAEILEQARRVVARIVDDDGLADIVDLTDAEEAQLAALEAKYYALTEREEDALTGRFRRFFAENPTAFESL